MRSSKTETSWIDWRSLGRKTVVTALVMTVSLPGASRSSGTAIRVPDGMSC